MTLRILSLTHIPEVFFTLGIHMSLVCVGLFSRLHSVADVVVSFAIGLEMCIFRFFL